MRDSQVNDHRGISEEEEEGLSSLRPFSSVALFIFLKWFFYRAGVVTAQQNSVDGNVTVEANRWRSKSSSVITPNKS